MYRHVISIVVETRHTQDPRRLEQTIAAMLGSWCSEVSYQAMDESNVKEEEEEDKDHS